MARFFHNIKNAMLARLDYFKVKRRYKSCRFFPGSRYHQTIFGGWNVVYGKCDLSFSSVGIGTYIGARTSLPRASIGKFCSLGCDIVLVSGKHPTHSFVSTSPIFYDTESKFPLGKSRSHFKEFDCASDGYSLHIGNDVWIGRGVLLKEGITIGDGAIIGMGSVVVGDVKPYEIVGGNPAKLIRLRFDSDQIEKLLTVRWWDWPISVIQSRREDFSDIVSFLHRYFR